MINFRTSPVFVSGRMMVFLVSGIAFFVLSIVFPVSNIDPYSDLGNYHDFWVSLDTASFGEIIVQYEPGFVIFAKVLSFVVSFSGLIWTIKFLLFYSAFLFALKIYGKVFIVLILVLVACVFFPPYDSISSVAIRQGLATAVLFFYLSVMEVGNIKLKNVLFLAVFLACFHYSAIFVSIALLLYLYLRGIYPFVLWFVTSILYIFNLPGMLGAYVFRISGFHVASLAEEAMDLGHLGDYVVGFKVSFFFVSTVFVLMPIALSYFALLNIRVKDLLVLPLFRFYFLLNSLCLFTSLLPYHDRFFTWSWVFCPMLVISALKYSRIRIRSKMVR